MNLFSFTPPPPDKESFTTLLEKEGVKIKQIVSNTLTTPQTFHQECDEWVCVLKGCAKIEMQGIVHKLKSGDTLFIPAHTPHTLLKTRKMVVWLAVYIDSVPSK